jgi:hypothetical protein
VESVVVVAVNDEAVTVTEIALEVLVEYAVEPPYTAVSEYVPAVANDVVNVAVPELNVAVPNAVEPE